MTSSVRDFFRIFMKLKIYKNFLSKLRKWSLAVDYYFLQVLPSPWTLKFLKRFRDKLLILCSADLENVLSFHKTKKFRVYGHYIQSLWLEFGQIDTPMIQKKIKDFEWEGNMLYQVLVSTLLHLLPILLLKASIPSSRTTEG